MFYKASLRILKFIFVLFMYIEFRMEYHHQNRPLAVQPVMFAVV